MEKGNGKERSKWIAPKEKFLKNGDVVSVGDLEQGFVIIRVFRLDCEQSLIFLCKVAKPLAARNESVSPRRKIKRPVFSRLVSIPI